MEASAQPVPGSRVSLRKGRRGGGREGAPGEGPRLHSFLPSGQHSPCDVLPGWLSARGCRWSRGPTRGKKGLRGTHERWPPPDPGAGSGSSCRRQGPQVTAPCGHGHQGLPPNRDRLPVRRAFPPSNGALASAVSPKVKEEGQTRTRIC